MIPIDLILVRHGQSEGNLAQSKKKRGDASYYTEEFKKRHTSRYRLTRIGQEQARETGDWIRKNMYSTFDRYYCSDYVRARETGALLGFENAEWYSEFYLREQDMGGSDEEKTKERESERRKLDNFYYAPPGGESIANCCLRVDIWLKNLEKSCSGFRILTVVHGNIFESNEDKT
jgi:broad specificity phosphatase PhoE